MERSIRQRDAGARWMLIDPYLAGLRGDSRYTSLLAQMHLPPVQH